MTTNIPIPTTSELEILQHLWELESASVREIHLRISEHKTIGYTTTLKFLQLMTHKGLVMRRKEGNKHIYHCCFTSGETKKKLVQELCSQAFNGQMYQLAQHILTNHIFSSEDRTKLKERLTSIQSVEDKEF